MHLRYLTICRLQQGLLVVVILVQLAFNQLEVIKTQQVLQGKRREKFQVDLLGLILKILIRE